MTATFSELTLFAIILPVTFSTLAALGPAAGLLG